MRRAPGISVVNLLMDLDGLAQQLLVAAGAGASLDAFLLAAGINQIVEDRVHAAPYPFDETRTLLGGLDQPRLQQLEQVVELGGRALRDTRNRLPALRRTVAFQFELAELVSALATDALAGTDHALGSGRCAQLAASAALLPRTIRESVVRLPACFHDFDQRPEDLQRLAERFAQRFDDRDRTVLVAGVRTSGSYLAPLLAAALASLGFHRLHVITIRPGQPLLAHERALLAWISQAGGAVALIDDPPVTGSSFVAAASTLERLGIARPSLAMLVPLLGEHSAAPDVLDDYRPIVLASDEWAIRRSLTRAVVATELESLLAGTLEQLELRGAEPAGPVDRRAHAQARFHVRGHDPRMRASRELSVLARGAGLGYLGTGPVAVARSLDGMCAPVLGVRDGILLREWLPEEARLHDPPAIGRGLAGYVDARRRAFGVDRDYSLAMHGQQPVWEVAGLVLSGHFGPYAPLARATVVFRAVRRLLRVDRPCVVDGHTGADGWFAPGDRPGGAIKAGAGEHTNWRLGLATFDPVFDLAGAGATEADGRLAAAVRHAWTERTGEHVSAERWLLLELAHLWGRQRGEPGTEAAVRNASARAAQRYFAEVFLDGLQAPSGPLCALDIDGVLENDTLGFPSMTRTSGISLRALIAHGYRPVPVTGRGLEEVRDRCRAFELAGGVAEYGAVAYTGHDRQALALTSDAGEEALERIRAAVRRHSELLLDPGFRHVVRAYRLGAGGRRRGLRPGEAEAVLAEARAGEDVRAVPGDGQTDFVPTGIDKAVGLRALQTALGGDPIAFAVGDTRSDAPMLALAQSSYVPAHAEPEAAASATRRVGSPYQRGLGLAVTELIGHRPGACPVCALPRMQRDRRLLLELLSVSEGDGRAMLVATLKLAVGLW